MNPLMGSAKEFGAILLLQGSAVNAKIHVSWEELRNSLA